MSVLTFLHRWFGSARVQNRRRGARRGGSLPRHPYRPVLEVLEDRCVPSATVLSAVDDRTDTDGTTPVAVNVLANDSPAASAHLVPASVTVVTGPQHGSATVSPATGQITYTAFASFGGT